MARLVTTLILSVSLLFGLAGCESNENVYPEAKEVAARYFVAAKAGDIDTIMSLYHESFFEERVAETWRADVQDLWQQVGVPFENTLESAVVEVSPLGTEVILSYSIGYSGGMIGDMSPGVEVLHFVTPTTGGPIRLIGHTFRNNAAKTLR